MLPDVSIVEKILPEFIDIGLGGLEVYYPGHTKEHSDLLLEWCREFDLIATGGSDCHDSSTRTLGVTGLDKNDYSIFKDVYTNL